MDSIKFWIDRFNEVLQICEPRPWQVGNRLTSLDEQGRQILLCVGESNVWSVEADPTACVDLKTLSDAVPHDGADKNVGTQKLISAGCALSVTTQLLELGNYLLLINVC